MIGKRYGSWVVKENDKDHGTRVICECDCGTVRSVLKTSLKYDRSKSCGRSKMGIGAIDEVGNRYGRLFVVKRAKSKPSGAAFECLCDCGKTTIVLGGHLRGGTTKSCGCYRDDLRESERTDLSGKRFGKLVALSRSDHDSENSGKWHCRCDCGEACYVNQRELISSKTRSCGCLTESYASYAITKFLDDRDIKYEKEASFEDLLGLGGGKLRYDWKIFKDNNDYFLLEYDGIQHFLKSNPYWSEEMVEHDKMKDDYTEKRGITLYRIKYTEDEIEELKSILSKEEV